MDLGNLKELLSTICKKPARIAVLGVGNYLRADDFLGVALIQHLKERIQQESVLLLEAEIAPSDFFPTILEWNPTHLIIIDATDFKKPPGTLNLIERTQIANFVLSSHKQALTLLIDLLSHYLPDLKIIIIGIQPESIAFEIGLSRSVEEAIQKLTDLLVSVLSSF